MTEATHTLEERILTRGLTRAPAGSRLHCGLVFRVREDECEVSGEERVRVARFAPMFPSPRPERVQPGNLVAMTTATDGVEVVVWRWFDAVVLGDAKDGIRLWEPAHGEVLARARAHYLPVRPGSRAYLSAGLPGADWWVAGPAVAEGHEARVELDEVERFFGEHGWWTGLRQPPPEGT